MDKPTLYMETTIPSYLLAEPSRDLVAAARQEITRTWWRRHGSRFTVFVSAVVLEEAQEGNRQAARKRCEFLDQFRVLELTSEAEELTQLYVDRKVVPERYERDAAHLALATIYEIQFLCTWNLRHLANAFALKRFHQLNEKQGLFSPLRYVPRNNCWENEDAIRPDSARSLPGQGQARAAIRR